MMRRPSVAYGALVGGLTSLPAMALMYLGQVLVGLPFVPFDLFDWLARVLPGQIVAAGIGAIVALIGALDLGATDTAAKRIEQSLALALFVGGGVVLRDGGRGMRTSGSKSGERRSHHGAARRVGIADGTVSDWAPCGATNFSCAHSLLFKGSRPRPQPCPAMPGETRSPLADAVTDSAWPRRRSLGGTPALPHRP